MRAFHLVLRLPTLTFALSLAVTYACSSSTSAGGSAADASDAHPDSAVFPHVDASPDAPPDARASDATVDAALAFDAVSSHEDARGADAADSSMSLDAEAGPPTVGDANATDGPLATDASPEAATPSTCADGAPVAYTRTSCSGSPAQVPSGLASSASGASFGAIVALDGLDDASLPCFPVRVCVANGAPTLLFSDDPESPSADGILYADELVSGSYRAYVYHTNAGTGLRKFPVVLLNQGTSTVHASITRSGVAGPSQDYIAVGKQALENWFSSEGTTTLVAIPAGQRVVLDTNLGSVYAGTNELAHAILDFSVDGPVKLSVVSLLSTEDPTTVTSSLSLLPDDGLHTRGTFAGAALEIEPLTAVDGAGARHLRLGANVTDATLTGRDYVDATNVTLDGNYGVSYAINLAFAASAPSAILLSPQGGDWGGAALASSGPAALPASQDALGTQTDGIALGVVAGGATSSMTILSAGGSSLPVDLVTVPTL